MDKEINRRHGGPFDRGSADSYYGRRFCPHYFIEGSYTSPLITQEEMTDAQIEEYKAGWNWNEEHGDKKDWGFDEYEWD